MKKFCLMFLAAVMMVVFGGYSAECATYSFSDLDGEWVLTSGTGNLIGTYAGQSFIGTATAESCNVRISNIKDLGNGTADCNIKITSVWNCTINTSSGNSKITYEFIENESQTIAQPGSDTFGYSYDYQSADADETGIVTITFTSNTTGKVVQLGTVDNGSGTEINYEFTYYLEKKESDSGGCNAGYGYIMLAALGIIPIVLRKK